MGDTDTLTAMKIGFGAVEAAIPFKLNVYEVDDTDVTHLLRTVELERAKEAGFQEFTISPMLLEKDKRYFMEVEQVGADYMALAYEPNEKGQYHTKMGWYYAEGVLQSRLAHGATGQQPGHPPRVCFGRGAGGGRPRSGGL